MKKGFILVVSGPAGVGKGTVEKEVFKNHPEIVYSVSATTRSPRAGEVDGVDYFFVSEEKFDTMIQEDAFLEHAHVHTNRYGTPRKLVEEKLNQGKIVVLEIDVQGAEMVFEKAEDVVSVFILPPSIEELEYRIRNRNTETEEQIQKRMHNAKIELGFKDHYTYQIVNDDLTEAVKNFDAIVRAEKLKTKRN